MDLEKVQDSIDRVCPRSHHEECHTILPIPGRNDVCFAFCEGWGNRLFLVWESNGKIHRKRIAGASGYQVLPDTDTLVRKGTMVEIYCGVMNFIGASPGAELVYELGKPGHACPRPAQRRIKSCC